MKSLQFPKLKFHLLLLLVWIVIGSGLRFTQLTLKSPWTDEFATLVFSLGNTYQTVPLDQAISLHTLLQALQPNPTAGISTVVHHLFREDHHPPLYFVLAHWWMQLFPGSGDYASLWVARSLPAVFGVASIPAVYGLGWLAFRSQLAAQLTAAMMAVCPYSIYLSQEARHYTLGILWVIASLCGLAIAFHNLQRRTPLPLWVALSWVVVNTLGMATHYFFSLTLCAEAIVLIGFWILDCRFAKRLSIGNWGLESRVASGVGGEFFSTSRRPLSQSPVPNSHWWRLWGVAAGTFLGCLVWIPVWQASHDEQMTQWIMSGNRTLLSLIGPIFQALAAWITMLSLLPVEASSLPVVIASGAVMIAFFVWAVPILYHSLKGLWEKPDTHLMTGVFGGFVLSAIALFFAITYFLGTDLTRGARYNFVYFPAVIVLVGAALAIAWNASETPHPQSQASQFIYGDNLKSTPPLSRVGLQNPQLPHSSPLKTKGKRTVALIWLMSLLSGITVVSNLGYQKYYRPDLLVPAIQQTSQAPILIATTHNTLVQTGEIMGIAWEFKRATDASKSPHNPQFLLAHQDQEWCEGTDCRASTILEKTLAQLPRPLDLWLVNFKAPMEPDVPNCFEEEATQYQRSVDGYATQLYHCLATESETSQRL